MKPGFWIKKGNGSDDPSPSFIVSSVPAAIAADPFCFPGSVLLFGIRPSFRDPALRFIRVLRLRRGVHLLSGRQEF